MSFLFVITLNVSYTREHYFTINVFKELAKTREEIILASIFLDRGADEPSTEKSFAEGRDYYTYRIPPPALSGKKSRWRLWRGSLPS